MPKELTTVTPLSKYLAMVIFIVMPFIGFFLGIRYQEMQDLYNRQQAENILVNRTPTPTPDKETKNWKTYTNSDLGFSIDYPPRLKVSQEPKPFKNINGTTWILALDDRKNGDTTGTTFTTSIKVQFAEKPISGESRRPITKIEDTFLDVENVNFFKLQNYPAGKGKIGKMLANSDEKVIPREVSVFVHILKDNSLWTISGDINGVIKNSDITEIDQILSTFKFTGQNDANQVVCTQEVKQCPDGSYVGRTGPNCEFAPCPN